MKRFFRRAGGAARPGSMAVAACCALVLGGCAMVGPDYERPDLPASQAYGPRPLPAATAGAVGSGGAAAGADAGADAAGGAAQRFVAQQDIRADWWTLFGSRSLDALIERALAANPDLEAAEAALRVAQYQARAQRAGALFPSAQAGYRPERLKLAGNLGGNSPGLQGNGTLIATGEGIPANEGGTPPFNSPVIYNFHTAQLTVGYTPDVFGGARRQAESAQASVRAEGMRLEAARITLASHVVAAAIRDAALRRQIDIVQDMLDGGASQLALARRQFEAGQASRLDLAVHERVLAATRQLLPPLKLQLEQNRALLRVLAGTVQDDDVPAFTLAELRLPEELPLSLPSRLIEQRPDVRAAEERLRAATAEIGVARAARLPQFNIEASWGGAASVFSQMFWNSGKFFELGLGMTQLLFDGGRLKHQESAAREAAREAAAQYRSTVLSAYQDVANTLHAVYSDAEAFEAAAQAGQAAEQTVALTRRQHRLGYLDRLALIAAEQDLRQAQMDLAQAHAARLDDTAALFLALGGGWWHRQDH